jgi:hypothetical protein
MVTTDFLGCDRREEPIFFVELLKCDPKQFNRLHKTVANFLDKDCRDIPGYRGAQLLTGEDHLQIILVTEWETREAWCSAQWNAKVGQLAEALCKGATTVDYSLCYRDGPPVQ